MPVAAQRPQFAAMSTMMPVVIEKFGTTTTTTVSSELLPHMVRGVTPEGAAAISKALDELRRVGLTQLKVEHSGPGYILVGSV